MQAHGRLGEFLCRSKPVSTDPLAGLDHVFCDPVAGRIICDVTACALPHRHLCNCTICTIFWHTQFLEGCDDAKILLLDCRVCKDMNSPRLPAEKRPPNIANMIEGRAELARLAEG